MWSLNSNKTYPERHLSAKGEFGFYSGSSVCFPDLYAKTEPAKHFALFIATYNLVCLILISIGYAAIFKTTRANKQLRPGQDEAVAKKNRKMMRRILYIILTDMACWTPIIVMSLMSYSGFELTGLVQPISAIVFLPINSFLNPIIYSRIDKTIKRKLVQFARSAFKRCFGSRGNKNVSNISGNLQEMQELETQQKSTSITAV